jgi:8-oxo-dGTP diphosphatase
VPFRLRSRPLQTRPVIPVVCAIIQDTHGRILLAQRPAHKHLGLKWEFPGGKVEPDESPEAGLSREIREELACEIRIERALPPFLHDYTFVLIEMFPFICALAPDSAPPHPHEHTAITWAAPGEIAHYDLAPADIPLLNQLS